MRPAMLLLACVYGHAADGPSFEVASVKPASPAASRIDCSGGPGTKSPGIWRCSNVPLSFVISQAYGFQAYQFPPSAACCRARFDFNATLPEGATPEQFHSMLRKLLAERLQLKLHHEQKEMPIFELAVGAHGPKMKESPPDAPPAAENPWAPPQATVGQDGYPVFPPGRSGVAGFSGRYRWTAVHISLPEIVKTLSFYLGLPVVDATGLNGKYDFNITWVIDMTRFNEMAGLRDESGDAADNAPTGPTLIRAVQDQLGLKLVSKKVSFPQRCVTRRGVS